MKKALLFSVLFIALTVSAFAYETIIIHFPDGENWGRVFYKKIPGEAILQYTPNGQTTDNWKRSIVIHSYEDSALPVRYMSQNMIRRMQKANPTVKYKTIKLRDNDAIFTRCTEKYNNIEAQCEFYRVSKAHGGIITIHYMNKNKTDFMNNYTIWLEIIRKAKFYNSYYRDERTFDKALYFEL